MAIYQGNKKVANNYYIDNTVYCVPIGTIISYTSTTPPTGFLVCDGSEISKTDYADLYEVIGDKFGTATDNTKFKLPDLRDKFVQGANDNLGTSKEAGLPNITGKFTTYDYIYGDVSGSFTRTISNKDSGSNIVNPTDAPFTLFNFNASQSNAIYGNSDTVQPPAVCLTYIIKATKLSDMPIETSGIIDDNSAGEDKTWSSKKINESIPTKLPANGGNADTVNNHTVLSNVPANAKFTDTVTSIEDSSTTSTTSTWSAQKINATITSSKNARIILSMGRDSVESETKTAKLVSLDGAYLYWSSQAGTHSYIFGIILYVYNKWMMIPIAKSSDDATTGISFSITNSILTMTRQATSNNPTAGSVFALGSTLI